MKLVATVAILGLWFCVSVQGSDLLDKITVLQDPNDADNKTMVVVTWANEEDNSDNAIECEIFTDERLIEEVLKVYGEKEILHPTKDDMQEILEECTTFSLRRRRRDTSQEDESLLDDPSDATTPSPESADSPGWNVIFPGTKWCGAGDIAKHDDDLGFHQDTDRCCRAHDKCDDLILAGETKYNLTNRSPFTKLSCKCDHDFYDCLSRVNTVTSNTIGNTYFNVLMRPCYQKNYPLTKKCKKYRSFLKITCIEYERDTKAPPVYQWVSAKKYKRLPFPGPLTITLPF